MHLIPRLEHFHYKLTVGQLITPVCRASNPLNRFTRVQVSPVPDLQLRQVMAHKLQLSLTII